LTTRWYVLDARSLSVTAKITTVNKPNTLKYTECAGRGSLNARKRHAVNIVHTFRKASNNLGVHRYQRAT